MQVLRVAGPGFRGASVVAIACGFLLLLLAVAAVAVVAGLSQGSQAWTTHTVQVREAAQSVFGTLRDAEASQRGYLLSGDADYLPVMRRNIAALPVLERRLRALTSDNPSQQARLDRLEPLVAERVSLMDRSTRLMAEGRVAEASASFKGAKPNRTTVQIRDLVGALNREEQRLYVVRSVELGRQQTILEAVIILAVLCASGLAVLVGLSARRSARILEAGNQALQAEIAERVKAENQLRQAQKMEAVGQLTGGIAHDFNNVLAVIMGSLDMATRRLGGGDERARALLDAAMEAARRGAVLTQSLLAFSRRQPLDPKPTDINHCVASSSRLLRATLGEKIEIETIVAGGLWPAFVDAAQLENAILNLAVNARDAMPDGGRLTLETGNAHLDEAYAAENIEVFAGQYVMVAVTDTGAGMPPEVVERAFDPFFTTKPVGAGTGLGLSQVHGFVRQSRGHVKIYSEPGRGTTVKLYLPRHMGPLPVTATSAAPHVETGPREATILVVEDEPGVRAFVVGAVRELGYPVIEADTGALALQAIARNDAIDLLLTDVVMPEMDGRRLADSATALRPGLKVLYMTGYTRNAIVHNGVLDAGANLITKPFTLDQLDARLRAILD